MKVLITGANRGLGFNLAKLAVERGHTVLAGERLNSKDSPLHQLKAQFPDSVFTYLIDVTNEESIAEAAKVMKEEFGSIDGIINNAGVLVERNKSIEDLNFEKLKFSFDVNLYGPMRIIKYFLPILINGENQSIINISSEAGSFKGAYGGDYPYALSKTALNMFSKQLSHYVSDRDIQVFSVHPGWIKTDMGGENAPGSPVDTANGIVNIIERKINIESLYGFIDYKGNSMPI